MRFQKLLPNNLAGVLNEKSNFSLVEYVDISRSLPNYRLPAKLLFKPKRKKFCFEAFATSTIWLVKTIYFNWLYFILFFQKALLFSMVVIFVSWFNIRFFCFIHTVELLAWNCLIGQMLDLTCHALYHGSFIFPLFHIALWAEKKFKTHGKVYLNLKCVFGLVVEQLYQTLKSSFLIRK